jgi:hypothetical protein
MGAAALNSRDPILLSWLCKSLWLSVIVVVMIFFTYYGIYMGTGGFNFTMNVDALSSGICEGRISLLLLTLDVFGRNDEFREFLKLFVKPALANKKGRIL